MVTSVRHQRRGKGRFMNLDTFGKRLRLLRQDRGMSQIDLRERMEKECGVSIGGAYISELERGDGTPVLKVAAAMAKVLDVSLDYLALLHDDASVSYRRQPTPVYFSLEADEVAQLVDAMQPEQRALIVSMARTIVAPTKQQLERFEARDILDSIEAQLGREVRLQIERKVREKRLPINTAI